ncbi:MAG: SdiA-regulated domain-containing protein [Solirubrobacteraceae bacterium]|nr:SdiA-regulated domain-containing protein [Solirubrobacteraceae bacterium]
MTPALPALRPPGRDLRRIAVGAVLTVAGLGAIPAQAAALTDIDLSNYVRVGRHALPEPSRTPAPAGNLLGEEASAVTYNPDTDTLFITGDGGTAITQVTKTGELVDTMTLAAGGSSQGTEFYDTEGITYIGNGEFVMTEERDRQLVKFTYAAGTTLTRGQTKTVKLGTTVGNVGLEGLTDDPASGDFIPVKETSPLSIFQTGVDWDAGTATNGSPTTVDSTNLFTPSLAGLADFSDVFALSNLSTMTGPQADNLILLSQESGRIVNVSRSGVVSSSLTIHPDLDTTISVADQTHEGVTMDDAGNLYVVSENGGGDIAHPQLWVYASATQPNQAPTAVALVNRVSSVLENTDTATRLKVADIRVGDDGLGTNTLGVTGPDASAFEVDASGLYVKAGVTLDFEQKASYQVAVTVNDPAVGTNPDATSSAYTLQINDIVNEGASSASLIVSEVSPWSSGDSPYAADWFEITNNGTTSVNLSGFKMDDNSNLFGSAVPLTGVGNLAPGQSAVFTEGTASTVASFKSFWFGGAAPIGYLMGTYSGGGVGLSTGGDAVNVFDPAGNRVAGVAFGASTSRSTFDNAAGATSKTLPLPVVSTLSIVGQNGAVSAGNPTPETGSPGTIIDAAITEVSPWSSGNSPYAADWFEVTNQGRQPLVLSGWKMDDSSASFGSSVTLNGVTSIAPGKSAIFFEGGAPVVDAFKAYWFGGSTPGDVAFGTYSGGGVGLSTGGDEVHLFDPSGNRITGVSFGTSTPYFTFDNPTGAPGAVTAISADGVHGGWLVGQETASPGAVANPCDEPGAIHLGDGSDTYTGTAADEVICGEGGDDVIRGGGGRDRIYGGAGDDSLYDGTGAAELHGGADDDTLFGEAGNDRLGGGTGVDAVSYQTRSKAVTATLGGGTTSGGAGEQDRIARDVENLRGGSAADTLTGDGQDNVLWGQNGNDVLAGGGANDTLDGGNGEDQLSGGEGNDTLKGLAGNDSLLDGAGLDLLYGGNGDDALTVTADGGKDVAACGANADTVTTPAERFDRANGDCETRI